MVSIQRAWSLIHNKITIVLFERICHTTCTWHGMCKEMPVIPVNRVVDPKSIIGKMEG
jgi:hypothetical protein